MTSDVWIKQICEQEKLDFVSELKGVIKWKLQNVILMSL